MPNIEQINRLISQLQSNNFSTYNSAKKKLSGMGTSCVNLIFNSLANKKWKNRPLLRVQDILKNIGLPAVPLLIKELNNPSEQVRNIAIEALGEIGANDAVEQLLNLLNHESSSTTRSAVIIALGKIGDERATKPVIDSIDDNVNVRSAVASYLRRIGKDKYIDLIISTLEKNLSHPDWKVRNGALFQLGNTKNKKAVETISKVWKNDKESVVREEAFLALRKILSDYEIRNLS